MPVKPSPEIDTLIRLAAKKYRIPYELLYAQVQQESAFNPLAVSRCGARGLMQIMPLSWRDITGCDADANGDIFDPVKNLDAGTRYYLRQYKACKHMIETMPANLAGKKIINLCADDDFKQLGLAAYNGGLGYVLRAINICAGNGEALTTTGILAKLGDPLCKVNGKHPDHKQMINYVLGIWTHYEELTGKLQTMEV